VSRATVSVETSNELSGAETVAVSALSLLIAPVIGAYLLDRVGLAFTPVPMLVLAVASAAGTGLWLSKHVVVVRRPGELMVFAAVVCAAFAGLLWLARPNLLPLGTGSDLTHHLLLIQFIERHWRLVHDTAVEAYLGEMMQYTPGSHILTALAGAWARTDGFHAVHSVVAASVALKAGFVFLIALRLMPLGVPRIPLALMSVVALLAPR